MRRRCSPFRTKLKVFERLLIGSTILFLAVILLLYFNKKNFESNDWLSDLAPAPLNISREKVSRCFFPHNRHRVLFFLETSRSNALNVRQRCAVESASLWNPKNPVVVLKLWTNGTVSHGSGNQIKDILEIGNLKLLKNVEVRSFEIEDLVVDTPIDRWFRTGLWRNSKFKVAHLSDAMRYVVLWKCGGIYLDLDVVVLRSLERLKNTVVAEHAGTIGNSFMVLDQGHEVLGRGLEEWTRKYDPSQFATNGPQLLSDNIRKLCGLKDFKNVSTKTCDDLNILPPDAAFPYPWQHWEKLFKVHDEIKNITLHFGSAYLLHFWNYMSSAKKLWVGNGTLYERAMKENCPLSYAEAKQIGHF